MSAWTFTTKLYAESIHGKPPNLHVDCNHSSHLFYYVIWPWNASKFQLKANIFVRRKSLGQKHHIQNIVITDNSVRCLIFLHKTTISSCILTILFCKNSLCLFNLKAVSFRGCLNLSLAQTFVHMEDNEPLSLFPAFWTNLIPKVTLSKHIDGLSETRCSYPGPSHWVCTWLYCCFSFISFFALLKNLLH